MDDGEGLENLCSEFRYRGFESHPHRFLMEIHPYLPFVPKDSHCLILGSFPGRNSGDFFYGSTRNQFWKILENVYDLELKTTASKQRLLTKLKIAITDIIYSCKREKGSNLDSNLVNITYNFDAIEDILSRNNISKIYFTSRFVEKKYKRYFKELIHKYPKIKLITLPSPSPRYAKIKFEEKIRVFRRLLPKLPV